MDSKQKVKNAFECYRSQFGLGCGQSSKAMPKPKVKVPLKKTSQSSTFSAASHSRASFPSMSTHAEFESMEERLLKELTAHYDGLSSLRKQMINLMWQEEAIQEYCDFMTDYCKSLEDELESDPDEDDLGLGFQAKYSKKPKPEKPKPKQEGYTFFTKDAKGIHYKSMNTEPGVPLRIEIDVKGFDPAEIKVDTVENEMTVTMKQKKAVSPAKICHEKTLGIICPTVEDLSKLNINYPKNGILLIEGDAANKG